MRLRTLDISPNYDKLANKSLKQLNDEILKIPKHKLKNVFSRKTIEYNEMLKSKTI